MNHSFLRCPILLIVSIFIRSKISRIQGSVKPLLSDEIWPYSFTFRKLLSHFSLFKLFRLLAWTFAYIIDTVFRTGCLSEYEMTHFDLKHKFIPLSELKGDKVGKSFLMPFFRVEIGRARESPQKQRTLKKTVTDKKCLDSRFLCF